MIISLIAAVAENNAIGKDNDLLWHLPADMAYFKQTTTGHCILTGRKNYESIPKKYRPLTNRTNIVVTRNADYVAPGAHVVTSIKEGIVLAKKLGEDELFVIGGGEIYRDTLPIADRLYITRVHARFEADTFFPEFKQENWQLQNEVFRKADEKNAFDCTFSLFS